MISTLFKRKVFPPLETISEVESSFWLSIGKPFDEEISVSHSKITFLFDIKFTLRYATQRERCVAWCRVL